MINGEDPPPKYGIRINQKTGKSETYIIPDAIKSLEQSRKELRDKLHGSEWYVDEFSTPKKKKEEDYIDIDLDRTIFDDQYEDFLLNTLNSNFKENME